MLKLLDILLILLYTHFRGDIMQIFDPRQNMTAKDFEIFHYKDAKFGGVPVHQHDFFEVYFFISGNVEYSVEGKSYSLKSGDMLLINPLELHQPRIGQHQKDYERIVLWINKSYLSSLCSNDTSLSRCFDTTVPNHTNLLRLNAVEQSYISRMLKELLKESCGDTYGSDLAAKALLIRLLVELNRMTEGTKKQAVPQKETPVIITNVLDYIGEHYCEKISLSSIADEFFVSKYYLSHVFNAVVGTSLQRYVTLKRLIHAKQMLSSGIKPTLAASSCGFGDYAAFYRSFMSEYGISPGEFAKGH